MKKVQAKKNYSGIKLAKSCAHAVCAKMESCAHAMCAIFCIPFAIEFFILSMLANPHLYIL